MRREARLRVCLSLDVPDVCLPKDDEDCGGSRGHAQRREDGKQKDKPRWPLSRRDRRVIEGAPRRHRRYGTADPGPGTLTPTPLDDPF
jgi:hypothetical protein